jgi:hypothetical protein
MRDVNLSMIGSKQAEEFISSPGVSSRTDFGTMNQLRYKVEKEKGDRDWVAGGNILLSTGERVLKEEFASLHPIEQKKLQELGVEGFNKFIERNFRLGESWASKSTDEFKVLEAVKEGYRTPSELGVATGLTGDQVSRALRSLASSGLIRGNGGQATSTAPLPSQARSRAPSLGARVPSLSRSRRRSIPTSLNLRGNL